MTIESVLSLHGYDTLRSVLPSGRLEFLTGETSSSSGLLMTPHTFHGGEEPEDASEQPWWLAPSALGRDREAMALHFPGFVEVADDDGPPAWGGVIDTGRGVFSVGIIHRFDHGLPRVVPLAPKVRRRRDGQRLRRAPHLFDNGNLCVADNGDWDPARDTVATVVAWAAHWHAFYVEWRFTGRWPAETYRATAA